MRNRAGANPLLLAVTMVSVIAFLGVMAWAVGPEAGAHAGGHADPFAVILIELAVVVALAMVGRWLAVGIGQPSVLGELLIGVVMGNIGY